MDTEGATSTPSASSFAARADVQVLTTRSGAGHDLRQAVVELVNALRGSLREDDEQVRACIARASTLLELDPDPDVEQSTALRGAASHGALRGGLAPWQVRKVMNHVDAHLDSTIRTQDLAQLVRLSRFHFCRAFRESFDVSPRNYVMRRRIERAQGLMLASRLSLGQVAAECGLTDQAYLNKLFRRFVGESPAAWKRARASEALESNR